MRVMYVPEAFRETRLAVLQQAIDDTGLALLISDRDNLTHVPMLLDRGAGPLGTLYCHLARANPHIASLRAAPRALAVFTGPQGYVSPNWYASKQAHHRVVPTWNYISVHAECEAELTEAPDALRDLVSRLTEAHEARQNAPWALADAPPAYVQTMLAAITGVTLRITALQGAWKLNQHKSAADRASMLAGFDATPGYAGLAEATRAAAGGTQE